MTKIIKMANGEAYRVVQCTSDDGKHTYEEIEPVIKLASKVGLPDTCQIPIPKEMFERAEAAAKALSIQFPQFVQTEIEQLRMIASALSVASSAEAAQKEADHLLFAAHDLKWQGGSFGFPLVTLVAASLCHLVKQAKEFDAHIIAAIGVHIDTIAMIVNEILDPESPEAKSLISEIESLALHLVGPATDD